MRIRSERLVRQDDGDPPRHGFADDRLVTRGAADAVLRPGAGSICSHLQPIGFGSGSSDPLMLWNTKRPKH